MMSSARMLLRRWKRQISTVGLGPLHLTRLD